MYFTIKDDRTKINCVMFAGQNRKLLFRPESGMNVLIQGAVSVFEPYGQYQLYVHQMEPDGLGALHLQFEQLKERLSNQGYFREDHKKQLPAFPNHIGVITSPTGAAIRDILTTLKRRYPVAHVTVYPVLVQGKEAADSIAKGIRQANTAMLCDVLIVGRGGGSIEELWSFNEAIVAEAIYESHIPIISAVGHETDFTISDFTADVRAATPTGAAEIAVPSTMELKSNLAEFRRTMTRLIQLKIEGEMRHLQRIKASHALNYPEQLTVQKEQELDKVTERFDRALMNVLQRKREQSENARKRLFIQHPKRHIDQAVKELNQLTHRQDAAMNRFIQQKTIALDNMLEKLTLLNPLEIMKRGYAIPYGEDGHIVRSVRDIKKIQLYLSS
ncbi:Exodeoxyribonuclease VII [Lentibacillus sp. JNUCC-1]|uniref:exodeoxyribonuclease VII large subunit n=1 Tax=Lentibacillus sp. JNUCC-1 TaxID=2654513 RepID=UPI0013252A98|nr:Exodeoxyribonuclease VII [Lentibacillus sp. JNUCC-1]